MPYCRKCGFEYNEGDEHCNKCGTRIYTAGPPKKTYGGEENRRILEEAPKSLQKTAVSGVPESTSSGSKLCKYCGFENDQENSHCHKCLRSFPREKEEIQKSEKAIQIAPEEEKPEGKATDGEGQSTLERLGRSVGANQGFFKSLLVLFVALLILYGLSISNTAKSSPPVSSSPAMIRTSIAEQLLPELRSHREIIENDFKRLEGLDKGLPTKMSEAQEIQYAEAVVYQAQLTKQHVAEYQDFVRRHESEFLTIGMSPAELLTAYDKEMLIIDSYLKTIEKGLQQMKSNREAVANLLKVLAGLLISH